MQKTNDMGKRIENYVIEPSDDTLSLVEEPQMVLFEDEEILVQKYRQIRSNKINGHNGSIDDYSEKGHFAFDINALLNVETKLLSIYKSKMSDNFPLSKAVTFQLSKKLPVHSWFQYTQGFSPQIVDYYLDRWGSKKSDIFLDPFVGSGTSLLQCQSRGVKSHGWDISPLSIFLCKVKTTPVDLKKVNKLLELLYTKFKGSRKNSLAIPIKLKEHFEKVFSQSILEQLSIFQNWFIEQKESAEMRFILCAALSSLEEVSNIRKHGSHYRFMNNDNVGVNKKLSFEGLSFVRSFKTKIKNQISEHTIIKGNPNAIVQEADARTTKLKSNIKADWIITSPPYLNRNNYIAQSKTEMFFGGLLKSFDEYRNLTKKTLRSHVEAESINESSYQNALVDEMVNLVYQMGESYKGVSEMIHGYFEDMNSVLNNLVHSTKVNSKVAFVVGCSRWSGVVVPTDLLIAKIAEETGKYQLEEIEVVRYKGNAPQQMAKFGRYPVRESVVILKRI
jgi:hypothetical protein